MNNYKDVFISHNHEDDKYADEIANFLEKHNISCYIDHRNISGGVAYGRQIVQALSNCKAAVLIASTNSNSSSHILNEIDIISENGIPLLPVFIDFFEPNDDIRYYLGRIHRIMACEEPFATYLPSILDSIRERLPKEIIKQSITVKEELPVQQSTKTVFEYIPERGIMVNPEDHQRNVSFRADTLINLLGGIYTQVNDITNDTDKTDSIFFTSGYSSGKNFAERINNQWDNGNSIAAIKQKLSKWCTFDSAVGWGKFNINVDFDEDSDSLTGILSIDEPFLVDKAKKRRVCTFLKGYCTGVLETLLDSTEVELVCMDCPLKSKFKTTCVFDIITKED